MPQTGWLKQQKLLVAEARSPRSRRGQGWFLMRAVRENPSQAFVLASSGF